MRKSMRISFLRQGRIPHGNSVKHEPQFNYKSERYLSLEEKLQRRSYADGKLALTGGRMTGEYGYGDIMKIKKFSQVPYLETAMLFLQNFVDEIS